jgi:hypothetical protein
MSVFVRILISDINVVSNIYFVSEIKNKQSFLLTKTAQFNISIPSSPSFRSFVPHSLHSGAYGYPHKSKCLISLHSPCLGADLVTFHSALTLVFAFAPSKFLRTFYCFFQELAILADQTYKSSSFSIKLI